MRVHEGVVPMAPGFAAVSSRSDLQVAATVVLADWNGDQKLDARIRDVTTMQYFRASISERLADGDCIGAAYVAFAACIGADIRHFIPVAVFETYLADEPVGLICLPEDGRQLMLELYDVMHFSGQLSEIVNHYTEEALENPCFSIGSIAAERIRVKNSDDPVFNSIDRHVRIIAAAIAIAGTS